mmetsp:Transcript_4798/g.12148  ORF Transcript_4798/g.12148 Transcript_4798/m.12148 type:complete len:200 (+) Transcript_4798:151-750(+)
MYDTSCTTSHTPTAQRAPSMPRGPWRDFTSSGAHTPARASCAYPSRPREREPLISSPIPAQAYARQSLTRLSEQAVTSIELLTSSPISSPSQKHMPLTSPGCTHTPNAPPASDVVDLLAERGGDFGEEMRALLGKALVGVPMRVCVTGEVRDQILAALSKEPDATLSPQGETDTHVTRSACCLVTRTHSPPTHTRTVRS